MTGARNAYRDTEKVGVVERRVQAISAAEVLRLVTTSSIDDDGVNGEGDRPDGVVRVAMKFTVRPAAVGCPPLVLSSILFCSL